MNQKERLNLIISTLQKEKSLNLKEIISLTKTSRDTARRDIVTLTENNLVQRTYGGVALLESFKEIDSFIERSSHKSREKFLLAKKASELIAENQLVYLDVSTTVSLIPQNIEKHKLNLIITNSIDIADQLLRYSNCQCRLLGGNLDKDKRCVVGTKPLNELEDYNFDISFLGVAGFDENGVYYAYEEDLDLKRKIRQQSKKIILLIDSTKIGESHNFHVFDFEDIDVVIVSAPLPISLLKVLEKNKVQVININGKALD
ncbi:DeoR/GlpR family DNA-binding transcription regulator [Paenibacillus sp. SYP-B4298]|uniref:DeoR/GlpR family DNA-binding transcription regulator n=1 Tax=Paenibacillus sp. SYP-B4298 TaxID=2996034 RepID=UPI0022DDCA81|nr:DeoR/GlpR family DNA-binding transcription regulator [Paenibacillus sp. SYP-B4298]